MLDFIQSVFSILVSILAFACAIALLYLLFYLVPKNNPFKKVDKSYLTKYLKECIKKEEYREARYVSDYLKKNKINEEIKLPFRYVLKEKIEYKEDLNSFWGFKRHESRFITRRWSGKSIYNRPRYLKPRKLLIIVPAAVLLVVITILTFRIFNLELVIEPRQNFQISEADSIPYNLNKFINLGLPLHPGHQVIDEKGTRQIIETLEDFYKLNGRAMLEYTILINNIEKRRADSASKHYNPVPVAKYRKNGFFILPGMTILNPYSKEVFTVSDQQEANELNTKYGEMNREYLEHAKIFKLKNDHYKVILDSTGYAEFKKRKIKRK